MDLERRMKDAHKSRVGTGILQAFDIWQSGTRQQINTTTSQYLNRCKKYQITDTELTRLPSTAFCEAILPFEQVLNVFNSVCEAPRLSLPHSSPGCFQPELQSSICQF